MKIIQSFVLFFCSFLLQQGISQNPFPPAFDIVTDTLGTITLPATNWQYVEDRAAIWTIDSVRQSAIANKFHFNTLELRGNNDPLYNYWVLFRIKNTMGREAHFALRFLGGQQSDIYLFEPNGKEHHFVNGGLIPWSKRDGNKLKSPFGGGYMPVSILAGDEWLVYMKSNSERGFGTFPSRMLIQLFSMDKMAADLSQDEDTNYLQTIKDSVFFGILLWVAIFNLFFFTIVKERVYLYFALYVFFLGFTRFYIPLFHLFFRENPSIHSPFFFPFCLVFIIIFITYFFRNLLKTYLYYPILDKLLLILNAICLIVYAVNNYFIDKIASPKWMSLFVDFTPVYSIIIYFLLLATLILFIRRPEKANRNMRFTLLPPFATWIFGWLFAQPIPRLERQFGFHLPFSYNWLTINWAIIEIICLIWMVAYFSWVLLERFNELRKQVVQKELEKEMERSQLIEEQKDKLEIQVEERTHELKLSLDNLKATQTQLIQKEKLASLGELTAGIAHEIQNPLNFVNNFSELSVDLVKDLKKEIEKPDIDKEYVGELFTDLASNQDKINHHGKRASNIVKGMLEHSRSSTGVKEPTDINKLMDESFRLSYHAMRAKDKDFNADYTMKLDEAIGKINIIPQDMGRVLINLFNNAFYAVNQRKLLSNDENYTPSVSVATKKLENSIEIRVKDNGNGIPDNVKQKIFQPFFTTKPTGEGTGLGLSLSYDIVVKGHGGALDVLSTEGVGSEFNITLSTKTT
jgi:two-component system, NtrC family, sensor kinase